MNNKFEGLSKTDIDINRFDQLSKMFLYLSNRKKGLLVYEEYLEGMCYHYTLLETDHKTIVAKLVNDFSKYFYYYEPKTAVTLLAELKQRRES